MIDLHAHSSMSDGTYTPEALVDLALETGLGALALTDHDSLAGLDRAAAQARGTRLSLVPGVELEIACETGEFHLLGLGLDGDAEPREARTGGQAVAGGERPAHHARPVRHGGEEERPVGDGFVGRRRVRASQSRTTGVEGRIHGGESSDGV